jgi:hypothetical protein
LVALLGDEVVEGDDGAREVERRVDGVGEVVAEVEVVSRGGGGDAVALREVGGVELFLLASVSEGVTIKGGWGWERFTSIGLEPRLSRLQK